MGRAELPQPGGQQNRAAASQEAATQVIRSKGLSSLLPCSFLWQSLSPSFLPKSVFFPQLLLLQSFQGCLYPSGPNGHTHISYFISSTLQSQPWPACILVITGIPGVHTESQAFSNMIMFLNSCQSVATAYEKGMNLIRLVFDLEIQIWDLLALWAFTLFYIKSYF